MASLDILCFNTFNLKNKIMKIEHAKIFRGPSQILKNISWPITNFEKYFMAHQYMHKIFTRPPQKPSGHPSYILNVWSLMSKLYQTFQSADNLHKPPYTILFQTTLLSEFVVEYLKTSSFFWIF